jgi:hypothetical protein
VSEIFRNWPPLFFDALDWTACVQRTRSNIVAALHNDKETDMNGRMTDPMGRPIYNSASSGEVERLFVVELPATQCRSGTRDESAHDERERT